MKLFCTSFFLMILTSNFAHAEIEMNKPIDDIGGTSDVIGASPVSGGEWPATRIFRSDDGSCTSTIVGAHAVLTAAHCVDDGGVARTSVKGRKYRLLCEHHPKYEPNDPIKRTVDFALCHSEDKIKGVDYETINTSAAFPRIGDEIVLLGYGCTTTGGFDRDFGVLHFGYAQVVRTPVGEDIDIVTNDMAAVCYGDSGGAAYVEMPNHQRVIIGVNSRGNIDTVSYISSTSTTEFIEWAIEWAAEQQISLCGVHPGAETCR